MRVLQIYMFGWMLLCVSYVKADCVLTMCGTWRFVSGHGMTSCSTKQGCCQLLGMFIEKVSYHESKFGEIQVLTVAAAAAANVCKHVNWRFWHVLTYRTACVSPHSRTLRSKTSPQQTREKSATGRLFFELFRGGLEPQTAPWPEKPSNNIGSDISHLFQQHKNSGAWIIQNPVNYIGSKFSAESHGKGVKSVGVCFWLNFWLKILKIWCGNIGW